MSLQIDEALREGFERTTARSGLVLVGVFLAFGLVNLVVSQSLAQTAIALFLDSIRGTADPQTVQQLEAQLEATRPLAVSLSLPLLGALTVVLAVLAETLRIVAVRVFASEATGTVPRDLVGRRIALATAIGVVAGVIANLLTGVGLVFFVVPGVYVWLSFFFVRQEVAVADKGVVEALRGSWRLSGGNRWELLGLVVVLFVVNLLVGLPGTLLGLAEMLTAAAVVSAVLGSVVTVFSIAVVTRAYVQLTAERDAPDEFEAEEGDEWSGGDEWDDPKGV